MAQEDIRYPEMLNISEKSEGAISIVQQLQDIQSQYYKDNKKNTFFKKSQKLDCAAETAKSFDIPTLFSSSTFQVPNTNKIVLDYTVFKMFANPNNYLELVTLLIDLVNKMIIQYGVFEMHVNMDTFSASAAERYIPLIKLFCSECMKDQSYTRIDKMHKLFVYNTPSLVNNLAKPLLNVCDPAIRQKIVYYSKKETPDKLKELMSVSIQN